jgi:hypothetical protein
MIPSHPACSSPPPPLYRHRTRIIRGRRTGRICGVRLPVWTRRVADQGRHTSRLAVAAKDSRRSFLSACGASQLGQACCDRYRSETHWQTPCPLGVERRRIPRVLRPALGWPAAGEPIVDRAIRCDRCGWRGIASRLDGFSMRFIQRGSHLGQTLLPPRIEIGGSWDEPVLPPVRRFSGLQSRYPIAYCHALYPSRASRRRASSA